MSDLYYILDERRRPVVVSRRRWRRWHKLWKRDLGNDQRNIGPLFVSYFFRGRSPLGVRPARVWRVDMGIPAREIEGVPIGDDVVTWKPDPVGVNFWIARDFPTERAARSEHSAMVMEAFQLLAEYGDRGGTFDALPDFLRAS